MPLGIQDLFTSNYHLPTWEVVRSLVLYTAGRLTPWRTVCKMPSTIKKLELQNTVGTWAATKTEAVSRPDIWKTCQNNIIANVSFAPIIDNHCTVDVYM